MSDQALDMLVARCQQLEAENARLREALMEIEAIAQVLPSMAYDICRNALKETT